MQQQSLLRSRFDALWRRCHGDPNAVSGTAAWEELAAGWGEAGRRYHGREHLSYCLAAFDACAGLAEDTDGVELALWFHDLVLEPGRPDNEQRSADAFLSLATGMPEPLQARVVRCILATTHRAAAGSPDEALVCDIDLASLGEDWERFLADSIALRAESSADWESYREGKLRFFEALLARSQIFQTARFRDEREHRARENIERLGAMLRSGLRL